MSEPRKCPNCHIIMPETTGFLIDDKFNCICCKCGKMVYEVGDDSKKIKLFKIFNLVKIADLQFQKLW